MGFELEDFAYRLQRCQCIRMHNYTHVYYCYRLALRHPPHCCQRSQHCRRRYFFSVLRAAPMRLVAVDERPSAIAISDNGELGAVGTVSGMIYLFEVIRNNPAEIRITNPPINRNIGVQTIAGWRDSD